MHYIFLLMLLYIIINMVWKFTGVFSHGSVHLFFMIRLGPLATRSDSHSASSAKRDGSKSRAVINIYISTAIYIICTYTCDV